MDRDAFAAAALAAFSIPATDELIRQPQPGQLALMYARAAYALADAMIIVSATPAATKIETDPNLVRTDAAA